MSQSPELVAFVIIGDYFRVKLLFVLKRKCAMSILDNSPCRRLPCVLSSCRGQEAARESEWALLKTEERNLQVINHLVK